MARKQTYIQKRNLRLALRLAVPDPITPYPFTSVVWLRSHYADIKLYLGTTTVLLRRTLQCLWAWQRRSAWEALR